MVVVGTQFLSCMLGDATPSLPVLPLLFRAPWPALSLLLSWLSPTVPASFHQASFTKQRYTVTDKTLNIQTDVFLCSLYLSCSRNITCSSTLALQMVMRSLATLARLLIFSLAACILLLSRSQQKHVTVFDLCFAEIETAFSAHDVPV